MSNFTIWLSIIVMACISFLVRALPFFLLEFFRDNKIINTLGRVLPPAVMLVLVIFSVKYISFHQYPYGLPECIGILATIATHLYKRNAFLSIFIGTATYAIGLHLLQ